MDAVRTMRGFEESELRLHVKNKYYTFIIKYITCIVLGRFSFKRLAFTSK